MAKIFNLIPGVRRAEVGVAVAINMVDLLLVLLLAWMELVPRDI